MGHSLVSDHGLRSGDCCHRAYVEQRYRITCTDCGGHTCPLHAYIDTRNCARCYACFSKADEPLVYPPLRYEGSVSRPKNPTEHVLIVFHGLHICGAARHCIELLDVLNGAGCETTVLALAGGGHWGTEFLEHSNNLVLSRDFDTRLRDLSTLINLGGISVVSAHYDPAIRWVLDNTPPNARFYAHFHTEPEFGLFTYQVLRDAGKKCVKLFFPSEVTRGAYSCMRDPSSNWWTHKTAIMPNATPRTLKAAGPSESPSIRSHKELRIGVVTRLDPEKISISLFVNTLNRVRLARPDVTVRVAGDGVIGDQVVAVTRSNGLEACVQFLGWVRDIAAVYEWADVMFLPSISETMPYTIIESIAFGKPIVAPKLGYFSQEERLSKLILTFEPGNDAQAACLIVRALQASQIAEESDAVDFDHAEWRLQTLAQYGITC
jgi:glycosyltransferase involved in cell wall biosynthesis